MTPDVLHPRHDSLTTGLTFVPTDALVVSPTVDRSSARRFVAACVDLGVDLAFVPAGKPWAAEAIAALTDTGIAPFWAVDGPFWPVIEDYGIIEGLRATLTRPEEITAAIDHRIATMRQLIETGIGLGARAIVIAEDLAGSEGPLVAPDFAIDVLMPRFGELVGLAATQAVPTVLHSDGDIRSLLQATARAGFSGVHAGGGLDFDGFEQLFRAARREDLVVMGGLQTVELSKGLSSAVVLGSRAGVLARLGGLILADDGGITEPMQYAAFVSAISAARDI